MEHTQELLLSATQAKSLVSVIFSTGLSDCDDLPPESGRTAFKIRWVEPAPYTFPAGPLAAARPFGSSDSSIPIYQVPFQRFLNQYANALEILLAYVLSHELAMLCRASITTQPRES